MARVLDWKWPTCIVELALKTALKQKEITQDVYERKLAEFRNGKPVGDGIAEMEGMVTTGGGETGARESRARR